jgi:hypothetical protein
MDKSLRKIAGSALLPSPQCSAAHAINLAASDDLVLVAHDSGKDRKICYATRAALDL